MRFNLIEYLYLHQKGNLVYYDTLTGTKSRQYYDMQVKKKYLGKEVLVAFVDIDNLKSVNDTCGHTTGSELLKSVAGRLLQIHGVYDVCRIGGDEFILLGNFSESELSGIDGISFGTYKKEAYEDMSSAVKKADERMYVKKSENHKVSRMEVGRKQCLM